MIEKPKHPLLQEAAALLTVFLVVGGAYVALNWGDAGSETTPAAPPRSATVSPATGASEASGLSDVALKGLAKSVAQALNAGDEPRAEGLLQVAVNLTGCRVGAFTGGPQEPPGLEDLAETRTRAWIREDAAKRGWQVGFGHSGEVWVVVAQGCGK